MNETILKLRIKEAEHDKTMQQMIDEIANTLDIDMESRPHRSGTLYKRHVAELYVKTLEKYD